MEDPKPKGYLARYGAKLIERGYRIVPIKRGEKYPPFDNWEKLRVDRKQLREMLEGRYSATTDKGRRSFSYDGSRDGVGIITGDVILADLDILDEDMVVAMHEYIEFEFGVAPMRVGRAPKLGLMFRSDTPFSKVQSSFFVDPKTPDIKHKVEILGQGQQFVAYARHPDTKKPYEWLGVAQPAVTPVADLPVLTEVQAEAIVAEFERLAREAGWIEKRGGKALALRSGGKDYDLDDPFAEDAQTIEIEEDELERLLMLVPDPDDYDIWTQIGMSLYHQYGGDARGLELWHEWSKQAHNYDSDVLDEKWPTFDIQSKGRAPITARIIVKLAKQVETEKAKEDLEEIMADLAIVTDQSNLKAICARIKAIDFEPMVRVQLVAIVQARYKAITNVPLPIGVARDMTRYTSQERKTPPKWLEGWVYCEFDETFYSVTARKTLSVTAFNATYGRKLLTEQEKLEGKSTPEQAPSQVALNLYEVPVVFDRRYMPGEDDFFWMNGLYFVNSYDGRNIPTVPDKVGRADRQNVERITGHFEHLFEHAADREMLIDALAYIVQNPGKRLNWAILIQGTEMDGKTFFFRLLAAMLAVENVRTIGPQAVEEKYTSWAEATQLVFVEEIRLQGHNRYDVLNRLKPLITNDLIPIRRMNVDTYMVPNMATYILATNFKDALPLDDNDTRYFVLFSRFQTRAAVRMFKRENPDYYRDLHAALAESPGAIRKWFLERAISARFDPNDRAPESVAKLEMIRIAKSEEQEGLETVLAESPRVDMSRTLLNATALVDEMERRGFDAPYGKSMSKLLLDNSFSKLGSVRIDETKCLFWSQEPTRFIREGVIDHVAIREYVRDQL